MNLKELLELKHCPICESEIIKFKFPLINSRINEGCKSLCFQRFININDDHYFFIFNKIVTIGKNDSVEKIIKAEERITNSINYWKKDYRYIAEILTREVCYEG